jgi:hypothetical protein
MTTPNVELQNELQQKFATGEMGPSIRLHGSNSEPLMSALGHKRTSLSTIAMSRTLTNGLGFAVHYLVEPLSSWAALGVGLASGFAAERRAWP